MNTEKNKKIDEILGSLDHSQRAPAPDFFYTRLKARMEKGLDQTRKRGWVLRPAYALATLVVILLINAFVLLRSDETTETNTTETESVQQSIAAEYSLNDTNTIYELSQEK